MNARILLILVALTLLSVAGAVFLLQSDEPSQSTAGAAVVIVDDETDLTTMLPAGTDFVDRQAIESSAGPLADPSAQTLVADHLAAVIEGRVISRSGQPRVGATVEAFTQDSEGFQYQLQPSGSATETDGSGEFSLVGVPSSQPLMLEVQADNAAPLYIEVGGVAPGESRQLGDLLVSSGTTLVGLIADETGRSLPNATIDVFDTGAQGDGPNGSRPVASAVSDGSGEYQIEFLAQRQYSIHAGLDGYTPMTSVLAFVLGGAGPEWRQNFTLWKADKIIAGRVIAADGSGLPEIEMRLVQRQKGGLNTYFTVVGQTDDRGEFRFDEVPKGLFDVTLNGAQWYIDGPLRLEAPRTDHEIIMHPSLTVNGQLTTLGELPERFTVTVTPDGRTGARLLQ
ncbi:MAG: protocatechuate 3,4-dioxygenase beta subunit, partial [Pseudohongiellaceae bacterium]